MLLFNYSENRLHQKCSFFYQLGLISIFAFTLSILASCNPNSSDPDPVPDPVQTTNVVRTFTSDSGGTLTNQGCAIKIPIGAVPKNSSGSVGRLAFSIETNVASPAALPSGYTAVGTFTKFAPIGFVLELPVTVLLPAQSEQSPEGLVILQYNELLAQWVSIPITEIVPETRQLGVSVRELGFFVIARRSGSFARSLMTKGGDISAENSEGGVVYCRDMVGSTYFILTVGRVISLKYPEQERWYSSLTGMTAVTQTGPTFNAIHPTFMRLPQGVYEIWVSKFLGGIAGTGRSTLETYSVPFTVTINRPLVGGWIGLTGWEEVGCQFPNGGIWRQGSPTIWPQTSVSYGTGLFQATLSWVNSSTSVTDVDLHLFGPNNMEVYYANRRALNGSFELDRDWTSQIGYATENIYSLQTTIPTGEYILKVKHYSGDAPKPYSVRVIYDGQVRSHSGIASGNQMLEIMRFTK
jgi:hypothetical protein